MPSSKDINQEFIKYLDWNIFKKENLKHEQNEIEKLRANVNQCLIYHKSSKNSNNNNNTVFAQNNNSNRNLNRFPHTEKFLKLK